MKKGIYRMNLNCGRMGNLEGTFISTDDEIKELITAEKEIYFGEVLGKYSEIFGSIEEKEIQLVTDDEIAINIFEKYNFSSGYNPFDYIELEDEE